MVDVFKITIPELTGRRRKRRVYIYLPESYDEDPERRYPVLYMFDGQNVFFDEDASFGKSWGIKDYMDYSGTEMIIAAVESNNDRRNGRLKEYAPFTFREEGVGLIRAKGRTTMDWLVNTFKPMVDANYRTIPFREATFIAGSSMGGLMSLYALLEYNQYFSRAASVSPAFETMPKKMEQLVRNAEVDPDTVLYMDMGDREFEEHPGVRDVFARISGNLIAKGVKVDIRVIPDGVHTEASWECQVPFIMSTLLYETPQEIFREDAEQEEEFGEEGCESENYEPENDGSEEFGSGEEGFDPDYGNPEYENTEFHEDGGEE